MQFLLFSQYFNLINEAKSSWLLHILQFQVLMGVVQQTAAVRYFRPLGFHINSWQQTSHIFLGLKP